jgi:hypothetical protein
VRGGGDDEGVASRRVLTDTQREKRQGGEAYASRGVTQVSLLPADAARLCKEAIDGQKKAETVFARFGFVNATFAAQKVFRAAAAYRDLALGLPPGATELQSETFESGG